MGQAKNRGTLEQRIAQAKSKKSTVTGWSEQHYNGLTRSQHQANNDWFNTMKGLLKPGGTVVVPNLGKAFNSDGQEK